MIRKADIKDIDQIMEMYSSCVKGMIEAGIDQWDDTYPNSEVIYKDIKHSTYYVKTMNNKAAGNFIGKRNVTSSLIVHCFHIKLHYL